MSLIEKLIRPEIRELSAYHVQNAEGMVKLDAMENPYVFSDELKAQWLESLSKVDLNRYPNPAPDYLFNALREAFAIPDHLAVLLGNGSDELIQILALALSKKADGTKACVLAPEPSFVMYKMIASYADMDYVGIALQEDFSLDLDKTLAAIEEHQPSIIYLAYPNNPTGNCFDEAAIKQILNKASGFVVLDEAYYPFAGGKSFLPLLDEYENLLVMRTVSKMGLAGLRFGYLVGQQACLQEFDKVRMPYNINVLTQASLLFALEHKAVFDSQAAILCSERELLVRELSSIVGLEVFPSEANFISFRTKNAQDVFEGLKKQGILIKILHKPASLLENCLRVTVGAPEENQIFLNAIRSIII